MHPDWSICYNMGSRSLLDIYTAFAASDLSFTIPLVVNNKRQNVSLANLLQHDLCGLYMQTMAGLADFAPRALDGPGTADGRLFSIATCQSLAMIACFIEAPDQMAKLVDNHLMKHAAGGHHQAVSGVDVMRLLDQMVSSAMLVSPAGKVCDLLCLDRLVEALHIPKDPPSCCGPVCDPFTTLPRVLPSFLDQVCRFMAFSSCRDCLYVLNGFLAADHRPSNDSSTLHPWQCIV